ncbi:hypothetical protein ACIO3S_07400 [Nocardioides sp. NPDC087217]|uniref:hypothetical protein n=1 Tax=Nocardioides sp. NPDC087217 TaxID=3364335 RepID=UPI0038079C7A
MAICATIFALSSSTPRCGVVDVLGEGGRVDHYQTRPLSGQGGVADFDLGVQQHVVMRPSPGRIQSGHATTVPSA